MKIAGWICLVIGVLSFFGAALKGNSVFGPLFWIALGAFLLHRVSNKEQEQKQEKSPDDGNPKPEERHQIQKPQLYSVNEKKQVPTQIQTQQQESLEDIQFQLTLQQREAAMCLISFFGGYNDDLMDDAPILIFKQSAIFFGLPDSPSALSKIMTKYTDADTLIDIVLTIKPVKAKEFLLLTCYDLIKSSNKSEAFDLLFNIANDMGYDRSKLTNLISLYQ